ncbi:sterol regulatory element-binding protein cleavage-activating protein [Uranotaenia lowii]|uniref:sterol regulatory element-binding protein cleavage-activating protein n=1 Tax=Uranotaenia lowii TaxID=190385 RepID=UPI00247AC567|nr:sterol regulatory element-binding protein cleavage-activating protein [Uranotaenia lowii]XP_055613114.1 sterol regulatory element-binding protein cleavage-activating protein [Uranotaenia lowii]XP_055613115.1 sterol regulatory element-binding protein cleavage-activating protein [Uranotaenia lowii]XP_055613116.1 sterol regulatory element-binding protein cleavage-activating protein [Uranotaenia lowii]XP_055613117.1 sterol regulatory element-binding protein cleavage-activating protein [Uranotaen
MTSSSNIDSNLSPSGPGGNGSGPQDRSLQSYHQYQQQVPPAQYVPHINPNQAASIYQQLRQPQPALGSSNANGGPGLGGGHFAPMATTQLINGKLTSNALAPQPQQQPRTISRQKATGSHRDGSRRGGDRGAYNDDKEGKSIPSRVGQLYYRHGLFLSSYPTCATSLAVVMIIFCCYPLLNIPLPGTIPTKVIFPYTEQIGQNLHLVNGAYGNGSTKSEMYNPFSSFNGNNFFNIYNISLEPPFPWARIDPLLYVQQIILRSAVVPWEEDLLLTDAFRGPLYEVFKLIEIIRNHEDESKTTLSDLCLHVENVKRASQQMLFPEYNCLLLSPANLWQQNLQNFNKDNSLLNTIFVNHNLQKSKVSTSEMLFGISLRDTGVKRYPMRVRSRIIQYAVTLILRENNPAFIKSLKEKLVKAYPLHQDGDDVVVEGAGIPAGQQESTKEQSSIMYIFYPGEFDWMEFLPQCIAIVMLFLYVYFSVRKIDVIRSRFVLASSAVLTVLGSLMMSLGMCFFFGLTISLQSKGVYPYLVILVGLENVLVITKSVLTTDNNLDVKIRIAQGLSREGWSITKNLLTEITILTVGLCTFVPVIQEFCIFAIVGLVSDFFLQMMFFSTVLALDIKRVEYSAEVKQLPKMLYYNSEARRNVVETNKNGGISRSMSHPKLSGLDQSGSHKKNSLSNSKNGKEQKIPKRLRIVNFWARTRFFQRGFMIWMILWISNIIYHSGLIELMIDRNMQAQRAANEAKRLDVPLNEMHDLKPDSHLNLNHFFDGDLHGNSERVLNITELLNRLNYPDYETVYRLSNFHWSSILKQYNISLSGRYVTVLPSIKLSHAVSPQVALRLRNPEEKPPHHFQWKAFAAALDPLDFKDMDTGDLPMNTDNTPFYPKTPMEILLSLLLLAVSIFMVTYTLVMLYRCMCTRNYAEWRASWGGQDSENEEPKQEHRILEGVPIQVNGHKHRIECIVTDGNMIASSCLQGQVKIWDATNGELMASINRTNHFEMQRLETSRSPRGSFIVKSEPNSANVTGMQEVFPEKSPTSFAFKLKKKLQFNFTGQNGYPEPNAEQDPAKFDFAAQYEKHFTPDYPSGKRLSNGGFVATDLRNRFLSGTSAAQFYEAAMGGSVKNRSPPPPQNHQNHQSIHRSHSGGEASDQPQQRFIPTENSQPPGGTARKKSYQTSPIWCLDFLDNLIVIGCADGRLEFWEGTTGNFKCIYETEHTFNNGVTNIKLTGDKVIVARLSGRIDFLRLETYTQGRQIDWGFTSAYRRTHIRTGSAGSINMNFSGTPANTGSEEELRCILEFHQQGHNMPVTCLEVGGGMVMTGSQDHTVKVFRLESHMLQYTLHGHYGPISCLFIDQWQQGMGASGCQDGILCVWDLVRGACMYKIEAHDDSIVALACSPSYVISLGLDERIQVWDRFQGQSLTSINVSHAFSSLVMLTPSLLVTGKPGSLVVWDVRTGEVVREVKLDCSNSQLSPRVMLPACGSVICDYGSQMRIVRFPLVAADKCE